MPKDKLTDYSATNASNTDVGGVNIDEGMLPSAVNNAIRELMTHQANAFGAGTPLYVDETNDRVGIGTTSTVAQSKMTVAGNSLSITGFDNGFTSGGNRAMIDFGANYMRLGGLTGGGSTVNGIKFITPAGGDAAILDSDGLKFNGDTAAANALDDYEDGSFSITVSGGVTSPAYTNAYGHYTKVGRLVYFAINLYLSSGTANGAHFIISGLPFTSANIASYGGAFANYNAGFKTDGNVTVHVPQNSTQIHFYERDGSTLTGTEISNVLANFIINGFYITA